VVSRRRANPLPFPIHTQAREKNVSAPRLRRMAIFKFFVGASIITNSALVCFRSEILGTRDMLAKTWIFNASQYVLFGAMLGLEMLIPDVPKDVKIQLKRQAHLVAKVIEKNPDEAEDVDDMKSVIANAEIKLFQSEDAEPADLHTPGWKHRRPSMAAGGPDA
jgi:hypothetical protein